MKDKSTTPDQISQHLIAGINLKNETDIEFFGIKKNKTVQFLHAGRVHYFKELPAKYFVLLHKKMNSDKPALRYFSKFDYSLTRKVELYTYFLYGSLDHIPDIISGILQVSENFRDSPRCPSLAFSGKDMTIDGENLTLRELTIIDMSARECTDFEIACELNISPSTLDWHKRNLFIKTKTQTKLGVVMKAFMNHIIH